MIYIGEELYVDVIRSILDLLQADDTEVRETAASIVENVTSKQVKGKKTLKKDIESFHDDNIYKYISMKGSNYLNERVVKNI